jgi:hypothetical protein
VHAVELIFYVGWVAFWLYWLAAAFTMKRGRPAWSSELRIRVPLVIVVVILLHTGAFRIHGIDSNPLRAGIGLALFVAGLAFAIWARLHIGRNWGTRCRKRLNRNW